jgi:hypothetical protein
MPARRFFAMRRAAMAIEVMEKIDLLDIQAVSICIPEYYEKLHERIRDRMPDSPVREIQESAPLKPSPTTIMLEHGTEQTKNQLLSLFALQRRSGGGHV